MTTPDVATPILRIIITLGLLAMSAFGWVEMFDEVQGAVRRKEPLEIAFFLFFLISVTYLIYRLVSPYVNL